MTLGENELIKKEWKNVFKSLIELERKYGRGI